MTVGASYTGRFAPSPTGPLHAGSLVAALASWLDARAHHGRWLLRIEDIDTPRCVPGAAETIIAQLAACGLVPDEAPLWQSQRGLVYQRALDTLVDGNRAYPCACTRQDIIRVLTASGTTLLRHAELVYPGICRDGLQGRPARAWRLKTSKYQSNHALAPVLPAKSATEIVASTTSTSPASPVSLDRAVCSTLDTLHWHDRWLGAQQQDVAREVGDFVLRRADGFWAYQLAVVVDDAAQGITHVVRGADLANNTARQIVLQQALGLPRPAYLHTPLVLAANGEKLSKQHGAPALDVSSPAKALRALQAASEVLGLGLTPMSCRDPESVHLWLNQAVSAWRFGLRTPETDCFL